MDEDIKAFREHQKGKGKEKGKEKTAEKARALARRVRGKKVKRA